ncbi:CDP-alcohol phosphatidyltransferase family protein [Lujinxingia vulgaris]|uniref:CDP-alcohol phosphatidyltransferase family protein n=1 Tax=Lujinxingia vulgaris TaxID=2600176 RepID=A0A5C6X734_9DELT|nr:CDP-alcohol phosphatidyltransferase family protein [Lujinxingia vulgaris]TXD37633.1 CDP-alcohol phosphatidyltransferase family protein [Lujinxingia vulgaris]
MTIIAITDLGGLPDDLPPAVEVAGLSLVDRIARMCLVSGVSTVVVLCDERRTASSLNDAISKATRRRGEVHVIDANDAPALLHDLHPSCVLALPAHRVFQRAVVQRAVERCAEDSSDDSLTLQPHQIERVAYTSELDWPGELAALRKRQAPTSAADARTPEGWSISLKAPSDISRAEDALFNDCRKPQDGIVSRHLNRHLSLAMSRALVSSPIGPNHISVVTFSLGIAAAVAAGVGGYTAFLLAGILYQLNSVIDGVDGELARVRYEFSVLGEWLDTVSDDLSDLLLYIGLGVGAWRTLEVGLATLGPEVWLYLGLAAGGGKLASMIVYYRWLIARGRGDLLAFEWSFKSEEPSPSPLKRALSLVHYAFRKDFIVFVAMLMAIGGVLPYLLVVLAPGNVIVAISVVLQQLRGQR